MAEAGTQEAVLDANTAFYAAFSNGDAAAMGRVWAECSAVVCISRAESRNQCVGARCPRWSMNS